MDEKKLDLIERSSAVFLRFGLRSVTMDDLCRELGVSKKTLYKYFEDKNDLVKTIIETKIEMEKQLCTMCTNGSENAIDELFSISRLVIENLANVNPSVFLDLQKHYPEAWKIMNDHKWEFILATTRENIERGIKEKIYRENLNAEIISKYYVASIDILMDGKVFPWPEFNASQVYAEVARFQIRGLANDNGIQYLKDKYNREINE